MIRWFMCWVWPWHDLHVVQQLSRYARKVRCRRCKQYFAMNDEFRAFLPWDDELEHLYADILQLGTTATINDARSS